MPEHPLTKNFGFEITDDRVRGFFDAVCDDAAANQRASTRTMLLDFVLGACESEIERLMAMALYVNPVDRAALAWSFGNIIFPMGGHQEMRCHQAAVRCMCQLAPLKRGMFVLMQAPIGPYRVDFLAAALPDLDAEPTWAVIECDGHDFHERTKEQAARDRKRDRYLTSQGYRVFRFTGAEIWNDPDCCAREVINFLKPFVFPQGDPADGCGAVAP